MKSKLSNGLKRIAIFGFPVLVVTACASQSGQDSAPALTECEEPRPQMCTMDYTPVCGVDVDQQFKTYGNACSACGAGVLGYTAGECK